MSRVVGGTGDGAERRKRDGRCDGEGVGEKSGRRGIERRRVSPATSRTPFCWDPTTKPVISCSLNIIFELARATTESTSDRLLRGRFVITRGRALARSRVAARDGWRSTRCTPSTTRTATPTSCSASSSAAAASARGRGATGKGFTRGRLARRRASRPASPRDRPARASSASPARTAIPTRRPRRRARRLAARVRSGDPRVRGRALVRGAPGR